MVNDNDCRGVLVLDVVQQGKRFQVFRTRDGIQLFAGYCDGSMSIEADRADVAMRALIKKHLKSHGASEA